MSRPTGGRHNSFWCMSTLSLHNFDYVACKRNFSNVEPGTVATGSTTSLTTTAIGQANLQSRLALVLCAAAFLLIALNIGLLEVRSLRSTADLSTTKKKGKSITQLFVEIQCVQNMSAINATINGLICIFNGLILWKNGGRKNLHSMKHASVAR